MAYPKWKGRQKRSRRGRGRGRKKGSRRKTYRQYTVSRGGIQF